MRDKPIDALNMVPFIDIMLVLLVIVLTTSTFIQHGQIPVRLPRSAAGPAPETPARVVEIAADGALHLQGQPVDLAGLRARVAGWPPDTAVLLRADRALPLQRFVDVAEVLRQRGLQRVAVQTDRIAP